MQKSAAINITVRPTGKLEQNTHKLKFEKLQPVMHRTSVAKRDRKRIQEQAAPDLITYALNINMHMHSCAVLRNATEAAAGQGR